VSAVVIFTGLTPQGQHLCSSLLHRIAAKENLVENNPELAQAMSQIRSFEARAEGMHLERFDAFRDALEKNVMRLLE